MKKRLSELIREAEKSGYADPNHYVQNYMRENSNDEILNDFKHKDEDE